MMLKLELCKKLKTINLPFCKKVEEENLSAFNFYSLSPTDQIENGKDYFNALNWALDKKNDKIKNIALTGSYGSGKSSILQSFQKQNTNKNFHFLNISLATFKEEEIEKDENNKNKTKQEKTEGENLLRLIELSILQQLFYREKDRKLPDSRLRKIKSFTWKDLILTTIGYCIFFVSLLLFIKPDILSHILPKVDISDNAKIIIHYASLIFCVLGAIYIIYKSIRIFNNLKINKLVINDAEIEISPEINKSILNHNLEEILYFFEATNYNVVIIEDLDRFQETEIFTKLREINLLINNSKKVNRRVTFIYAIRDEMFADKDRTKFFDFIIPVIPHINTSNSNDVLQREITRIANEVSETLIDDISLFIDEMRLLYNIINEFQIYKQLLSKKLIQDKLLAMIVYKNICPSDFVKLSNYKGNLYDTINKKLEYIKQQSNEIEKEITKYREEIKQLDTPKIKDIKELRALYILQYIKQINSAYKISYFYLNNTNYNFEQVLEDDIFPYLVSSNPIYFGGTTCQGRNHQSISFQNIEKQVDAEYTYKEREEQIKNWNNGKIQELKQQIASLEQKKNELNRKKIGELLSNKNISIEVKDNKQKLINLLLRNGYIDEDYLDYISLFHEGSLSKNDHTFLLNVKSQTNTDFTHPLDRIDKLIGKINFIDFGKEYILNYKLVDFILSNTGYEKQKEAVFNLLKNLSDISVKFIDGFIDDGIRADLLVKELYHYKIDIFDFMFQELTDTKLSKYLKLIVENADVEDLKIFADRKTFLSIIIADNPNGKFDIFDLVSDESKIKEVLKALNIKFGKINPLSISEDMINYIYQNNHYKINEDLLKIIIQAKGNFNQVDFDTRNYYAIKNSCCDSLISYIDSNISEYLNNVYLKLESNTIEDEDCLIELLNNEDLTIKEKEKIIQVVETKIFHILEIKDKKIENLLYEYSKLDLDWEILIPRFVNDENVISKSVIESLNNLENAKSLSKIKIDKTQPNEETVKKFLIALILNNNINDDSYSYILKSIPYIYTSLSFDCLTEDKVKILIQNNILELNNTNYTLLRDNFPNLHIDLIEKRYFKLTEELAGELLFDNDDIALILKSSMLHIKNKQMIIDAYDENKIINSSEILNLLRDIILNQSFIISKNVLMAILTKTKDVELRIKLYNDNQELQIVDTENFLNSLPEPYSKIAEKGKRPILPNTKTNKLFVQKLTSQSYISKCEIEEKGIRISTFKK